ncbi:MAG TPA: hypothetical protein VK052_16065 [Zeimonas sp.]|nr:hypothetical protein [Zeimonas sp.]
MGKLAERLADERRSGVYRVEVTDALEEAAAIDGFPIARMRLDDVGNTPLLEACVRTLTPGVDDSWARFAETLADAAWSPAPGHVLLFSGFEGLVRHEPDALDPLLAALQAAAARRRLNRSRFFAAFLDPTRTLSLDPLYDRRRHSLTANARVIDTGGAA